MNRVKNLILTGMVLGAIFGIFTLNQAFARGSADATLVKISPEYSGEKLKGFYVDPPTIYVKKNSIIVWLSGVPDKEIQIIFEEGKTCKDVTANPNDKAPGFFMDSKNCFVTSFLPYSATSTLQFVEVGTYAYEVVTEDFKLKAKGKIIVTE